jgi:hypothetical protein
MAQKIGSTGDLANFNKSQTEGQEDGTCMCGEREEAFLRCPQSPISVSIAGTSELSAVYTVASYALCLSRAQKVVSVKKLEAKYLTTLTILVNMYAFTLNTNSLRKI